MTPAEEIKARLDIVSFVQGYIKLEKAGINYRARCPFHGEKTPSFFVSLARDGWHCFGCGKGGDIFSFLMEMEGVEFPEALKILAERTGVELRRDGGGEERSEKTRLLALLEDATKFFEEQLHIEKEAYAYLKRRGLTDESIKTFRVGFAPEGWRTLSEHLRRKGYSDPEIEKTGMTVQGTRGAYDRFRSRIIFPLEDALGRTIGFGGRIFPPDAKEEEGAKYINTPQTILYDKSRFLYGFGKAKAHIRQIKNALVVEGYMDCVLAHQAGTAYTVAVSGTALTSAHVEMMRRLTDTVTFAFDIDKAGVDATRRAVGLAHEQDFAVRIVDIEGGKDPADIVASDPSAWTKMVEHPIESIQFFLKRAAGTDAVFDPAGKKRIGDELLPMIGRLRSEIERAHWVRQLAAVLRITEDALWRELAKFRSTTHVAGVKSRVVGDPIKVQQRNRKARLEEHIAGLVLLHPELIKLGELPKPAECTLPEAGELFNLLRTGVKSDIKGGFLRSLPDHVRMEAERYLFAAERMADEIKHIEEEFLSILSSWRELSIKEGLTKLEEEIDQLKRAGHIEEAQASMGRFQELATHLATLNSLQNEREEKTKKKSF